jgi:alkylation response protein AidB-like acyl-CoA dehydrogenase
MTGEAEFCEVFFEDVRVPKDSLLGEPGRGWEIAMGILAHERGPVWTFTFQRKIQRSLHHALRLASRRGLLRDPLARQRLAQAWIEVKLLKLMGFRSITRLKRTGQPGTESSIEKVLGSETDQRLQEVAWTLLGSLGLGVAVGWEEPWNRIVHEYLYARSETIMGGTSEIQRNLIAQRLLGLPRG